MTTHRTCGGCEFAEPKKSEDSKWYLCFRYPPVVIRSSDKKQIMSMCPDVHEDRRACGEWQSRAALRPKVPNQRT